MYITCTSCIPTCIGWAAKMRARQSWYKRKHSASYGIHFESLRHLFQIISMWCQEELGLGTKKTIVQQKHLTKFDKTRPGETATQPNPFSKTAAGWQRGRNSASILSFEKNNKMVTMARCTRTHRKYFQKNLWQETETTSQQVGWNPPSASILRRKTQVIWTVYYYSHLPWGSIRGFAKVGYP